jgi:hypothetical protein
MIERADVIGETRVMVALVSNGDKVILSCDSVRKAAAIAQEYIDWSARHGDAGRVYGVFDGEAMYMVEWPPEAL